MILLPRLPALSLGRRIAGSLEPRIPGSYGVCVASARRLYIGIALLAMSGCASQTMSIRTLPSETPAADVAAAIKNQAALAVATAKLVPSGSGHTTAGDAAASSSAQDNEPILAPLTPADAPSMYTYDPWEKLNRFTYRFNARFDERIFLPVADGYRRLPTPIRSGVHNFFSNLSEVTTTANYIMQLRFGGGVRSVGRFVINSTLGLGGLFDVATKLHVESEPTGFSMTMARWGVHPGPYLVIPVLGPFTLRDGVGFLADYGISYGVNVADLYRGNKTWALSVVNAVDQRANVSFRYYATGSPFEYELIRFLYVHKELIEDDALRAKVGIGKRVESPAPK